MKRLVKKAEVSVFDIRDALEAAGYKQNEPTEENLIECFKDYVDAGQFSNIDIEEIDDMLANGELTLQEICNNLKRV